MHTDGLAPSRGAWACLTAFVGLSALALAAKGWTVALNDVALVVGVSAMFMGIGAGYARWRPSPAISAACSALAFFILATAVLASLSYVGVSFGRPLMDAQFARLDAMIGFDWNAHLAAVLARPWLAQVLTLAYFSCQAQFVVVILGLALVDRKSLGEFMTLYVMTAAVVVLVSIELPAAGAYIYHAPGANLLAGLPDPEAGRWHMRDFTALRDGSFQHLAIGSVEGLITFPSFHATLGILFARALLRLPYLGFAGLVLNGLMIVSTLSIGGHYLVDVLAGAGIALAMVAALNRRGNLVPAQQQPGELTGDHCGIPERRLSPASRLSLDPASPSR